MGVCNLDHRNASITYGYEDDHEATNEDCIQLEAARQQ